MDQYVQNLTFNVLSVSIPSDECVRNLMMLTCSKCQKSIPKLCTNVCSAVAKGCFAPYYAALNPQFNIMWNVTAQLVDFINATLTDLFRQQTRYLNIPQFVCASIQILLIYLFFSVRCPMLILCVVSTYHQPSHSQLIPQLLELVHSISRHRPVDATLVHMCMHACIYTQPL